ncbi:hypothetical protein PE067_17265 [Paracoccus sp. DMF-8]|uniref:hypothetical protein n=1 Tax=Paracoccus sp. DMF-8 TaxID=3019445 RepID=UPI0023E43227|nr:hypothetical protein [Paracoccus sp. DMF-8]MDF3607735.1 hypothetical protein [Paracoccus sp. DMF-8]
MMIDFTVFDESGRHVKSMTMPDLENAELNTDPAHYLVEGQYDEDSWFDGTEVLPRPTIPTPVVTGREIHFASFPPGLTVTAWDQYTVGEHMTSVPATTGAVPVTSSIWFSEPSRYLIEFEADFPWIPLTLELDLGADETPDWEQPWVVILDNKPGRAAFLQSVREATSIDRLTFLRRVVAENWLQPADAEVLAAGGIPEIVENALVSIDPDQVFDARLQWSASYIVGRMDPLVVAVMDYFQVGHHDLDRIFGVTPYEVTP